MADASRLNPSGGQWIAAQTLTFCGLEYALTVSRGADGLPLAKLSRGGTDYPLVRDGCGCSYVVFSLGDRTVCTGTPACGGPCANRAQIKVGHAPCDFAPGWYCVRDCGSTGPGTPVELTGPPPAGVELLGGPYASEGETGCTCAAGAPFSAEDEAGVGGSVGAGQTRYWRDGDVTDLQGQTRCFTVTGYAGGEELTVEVIPYDNSNAPGAALVSVTAACIGVSCTPSNGQHAVTIPAGTRALCVRATMPAGSAGTVSFAFNEPLIGCGG